MAIGVPTGIGSFYGVGWGTGTLSQASKAAGMQIERNPQFPETLSAFTPEGDKIEIFRNGSMSRGSSRRVRPPTPFWQRRTCGPLITRTA